MKIRYFICAVAMLTGSLQAVGQTYSGAFHCTPLPGSAVKADVNVTAELTVKNGVAQMRRSSSKYEELLEGRVRGTSLALEGQGHFFDRPNPWTTRLKGSLQGNIFRAQGEIINSKGETTMSCEAILQSAEAPVVISPAVSASFDCQKASSASERAICNSPQLAALDVSLAEAYKVASAQATDKVGFKQSQNDWRKNVRDHCSTEQCLRDAYQSRLNNLRQPRLEVVPSSAIQEAPPKVPAPVPVILARPAEPQSEITTKAVEPPAIPVAMPADVSKDLSSVTPSTPPEIIVPSASQSSLTEPLPKTAPEVDVTPGRSRAAFSWWQVLILVASILLVITSVLWVLKRRKTKSLPTQAEEKVKKPMATQVVPVVEQPTPVPMQDPTHQVMLKGIKPNETLAAVRVKLGMLLKAKPEQIDMLLATPSYVLKKGLSLEVAQKYKDTLEETGLQCEICTEPPSGALDIDLPIVAKVAPPANMESTSVPSAIPASLIGEGTLNSKETILFQGDVQNVISMTKIEQGNGFVTNQRCSFKWIKSSFAAEKGELILVEEVKHGFATKLKLQHINGSSVMVQGANEKGLKAALYSLAGQEFDASALVQPDISKVKNTTAWIAAFGPVLAGLVALFLVKMLHWNADNIFVILQMILFRISLMYLFFKIDHVNLQHQGFNTVTLGLSSPEKFWVYLLNRAKVFGHGKAYAITWYVLIGIDIIGLLYAVISDV